MIRALLLGSFGAGLTAGCVYFNSMYDANREFDRGIRELQEDSDVAARIRFDSVIAKTGRIVENHPSSKYADDAALLKTRSELYNQQWESARETARTAETLSDDDRTAAVAMGLGAVALRHLDEAGKADSIFTLALEADLPPDDRALFLFERGLARQQLGRSQEAAADLESAAGSLELSPDARLTLSEALRDIGEYRRSAQFVAPLLAQQQVDTRSPLYLHVDSLTVLSPEAVDSVTAVLLEGPGLQPTRAAAFHLLAGNASLRAGDTVQALARFEEAIETAARGVAAADASYRVIELRLASADSPADIRALADLFPTARRTRFDDRRERTLRWEQAQQSFDGLVEAYEGRGASAAEAALRAAELARVDLEALAVARGLYLLYVRDAPESRWVAKAIAGALSSSGYRPDPDWVTDDGAETDEALRARLMALPADDPYRLVLTDPGARTAAADSAYVLAEADLRRRLEEIRRQVQGVAIDTAGVAADSAAADQDEIQF